MYSNEKGEYTAGKGTALGAEEFMAACADPMNTAALGIRI
jgi:hypothetical protein